MFQHKNKQWQTRTEHYYWRTTALLALGSVLIGLGFIGGAPLSPAFIVASAILPMVVWGFLGLVGGLTVLSGIFTHNRRLIMLGLAIGCFYTTAFGLMFAFSMLISNNVTAFTGIVWWCIIGGLHLMAILGLPSTATIQRLRDGI